MSHIFPLLAPQREEELEWDSKEDKAKNHFPFFSLCNSPKLGKDANTYNEAALKVFIRGEKSLYYEKETETVITDQRLIIL